MRIVESEKGGGCRTRKWMRNGGSEDKSLPRGGGLYSVREPPYEDDRVIMVVKFTIPKDRVTREFDPELRLSLASL